MEINAIQLYGILVGSVGITLGWVSRWLFQLYREERHSIRKVSD